MPYLWILLPHTHTTCSSYTVSRAILTCSSQGNLFKTKTGPLYPPILEQLFSELWGMYHFTVFVTTWRYRQLVLHIVRNISVEVQLFIIYGNSLTRTNSIHCVPFYWNTPDVTSSSLLKLTPTSLCSQWLPWNSRHNFQPSCSLQSLVVYKILRKNPNTKPRSISQWKWI